MNFRIQQPWGGLGDNLQYSTIPELCHLKGKKCILSNDNAYRNNNIKEFVWDINPYLEKSTQESEKDFVKIELQSFMGNNVIESMEKSHGFDPVHHYPKIYYTPKKLNDFSNKIIIDTKCVTHDWVSCDQTIYRLIEEHKNNAILIHNDHTRSRDYSIFEGIETLKVDDLFYYSDIINSCKSMYIVSSGISVLAPSIKHMMNLALDINVITTRQYIPSNWHGGYWFDNVNYITI